MAARSTSKVCCAAFVSAAALSPCACSTPPPRSRAAVDARAEAPPPRPARVIVFVWDGLRPDSIDHQHTPRLARLRDQDGTRFSLHHSAYPTSTMINAAALATGAYPAEHGFYGNTIYAPGPSGEDASGAPIDFSQPTFTE